MPPLHRPENPDSVNLPPRVAQLAAVTDVLVVGGGPAGLGAALGAANAGVRVILAERYGFLGGNATAALVMPLMSFHTQLRRAFRSGNIQAGCTRSLGRSKSGLSLPRLRHKCFRQ